MNPDRFRLALFILLTVALLLATYMARYDLIAGPRGLPVTLDRWTGQVDLG